ncbi:MAG: hypothetical protein ACP5EP_12460 [Acidobacteriaceae bacterium]
MFDLRFSSRLTTRFIMKRSLHGNLVGIASLFFGPIPPHSGLNGFNGKPDIGIGEDPAVRGGQVSDKKFAEVRIEAKRARIVVQDVAQQGQGKLPGPRGTVPPAESIKRQSFEIGTGWKGRVAKLSQMKADDGIDTARDRASAVEDHAVRLGTKFRWSLDPAGVQHLRLPPTENPAQLSDVRVRVGLPSFATVPVAMLRADGASPLY